MNNVWVTSDTHFNHSNIITYCNRPFSSVEEMNTALVDNWNARVRSTDVVWHLGDFGLGNYRSILDLVSKLNGRKRLVIGNHDKCFLGTANGYRYIKDYLDAGFEVVVPYAHIKLNGQRFNLSHFPYNGDHTENDRYSAWRLKRSSVPLIHGHTHSTEILSDDGIHVGVDACGYAPMNMDEVIERMAERMKENV